MARVRPRPATTAAARAPSDSGDEGCGARLRGIRSGRPVGGSEEAEDDEPENGPRPGPLDLVCSGHVPTRLVVRATTVAQMRVTERRCRVTFAGCSSASRSRLVNACSAATSGITVNARGCPRRPSRSRPESTRSDYASLEAGRRNASLEAICRPVGSPSLPAATPLTWFAARRPSEDEPPRCRRCPSLNGTRANMVHADCGSRTGNSQILGSPSCGSRPDLRGTRAWGFT